MWPELEKWQYGPGLKYITPEQGECVCLHHCTGLCTRVSTASHEVEQLSSQSVVLQPWQCPELSATQHLGARCAVLLCTQATAIVLLLLALTCTFMSCVMTHQPGLVPVLCLLDHNEQCNPPTLQVARRRSGLPATPTQPGATCSTTTPASTGVSTPAAAGVAGSLSGAALHGIPTLSAVWVL